MNKQLHHIQDKTDCYEMFSQGEYYIAYNLDK